SRLGQTIHGRRRIRGPATRTLQGRTPPSRPRPPAPGAVVCPLPQTGRPATDVAVTRRARRRGAKVDDATRLVRLTSYTFALLSHLKCTRERRSSCWRSAAAAAGS